MTAPRHVLAIAVLVVMGAAACADPHPATLEAGVEIDIEIDGARGWWASGWSMESGLICTGGSHRWIGYRMNDGAPIGCDEAAALKRMQPALVLIQTQLGCPDGTGAISIAWEPDEDDRWMVVGGTGAYVGAPGGGAIERSDHPDRHMTLRGEISAK